MDVPRLLEAARLLVPEDVATENDITVRDVWEYLVHDEWETALELLEELGDVQPAPSAFWEALAESAERMRMERSAAWCHWRCFEARHGVVRADLTLRSADTGRRRTPIAGAGVLRPPWDIGNRAADGTPALDIARLWVEHRPVLAPGGRATVRLAPLTPARWGTLKPGQVITMHEDRCVAGTAVVLEVHSRGVVPPPAQASPRLPAAAWGRSPGR